MKNRIGITFSADFVSDYKKVSEAQFGYKAGLNYVRELSRTWIAGIGLAYSTLSFKHIYEGREYALSPMTYGRNYTYRYEETFSDNYFELPGFIRANIGQSDKVRFSIKYGLSIISDLRYSYKEIHTYTGTGAVPSNYTQQYSERYRLFKVIDASAMLAAGMEIKLSEKFCLNLEPQMRLYSNFGEVAIGMETGAYYRF